MALIEQLSLAKNEALTAIRQPSPANPGDYFEFFAEIDLLCALSTCPGGDLSAWQFGESEGEGKGKGDMLDTCRPLGVEVYEIVDKSVLEGWKSPEPPEYRGCHGLGMPTFGSRSIQGGQKGGPVGMEREA